jgi:two-component system LytT family sensor kinase
MKKQIKFKGQSSNKMIYHGIITLSCALFALIFEIVMRGTPFTRIYFVVFSLALIQCELYIWLGIKFFKSILLPPAKDFTKKVLYRLAMFYGIAVVIAPVIFSLVIAAWYLLEGYSLEDLVTHLLNSELKGFIIATSFGLLIGAIISFFVLWQKALKSEQKLREENLIFQYQTLKNQINPHFLFNSLNTLSSLVNTQTEIAEKFINRLSSIYRYILENSPKDKVPLQAELTFINDYFFLYKIRDEDKIQINIDIKITDEYEILPVSLQLLIENAIKHNMATRENPLRIFIYLDKQHIVVKNNLQKMTGQLESTKTGLKNLSERIKLITGKKLIIEETKNEYLVKVPLIK